MKNSSRASFIRALFMTFMTLFVGYFPYAHAQTTQLGSQGSTNIQLSRPNTQPQQNNAPLTVSNGNSNYGNWGQLGPASTYCGGVNQDPCRPSPAKFESSAMMQCPAGTFPGQGECFTCPTGFSRSVWPAGGPRGCRKDDASVAAVDLPAIYAGDPIKLLKCEAGEFYDPGKGGSCWSCPPDTRRTAYPVTGPQACHAPAGIAYAKAIPSGSNKMCQPGQIHDLVGSGTDAVRNRLGVQFNNNIPPAINQNLGKGYGSCWSCPPGRKRTYASVWTDNACVADTIDFKPAVYGQPGMFRLDGAQEVVLELMNEMSLINLYAVAINGGGRDSKIPLNAVLSASWDEIAYSPATSLVLQVALWDRITDALANPQGATAAEKRLVISFADAIRRYRMYRAQSALDAYDLWYAADAYQKVRTEERTRQPPSMTDMYMVGFKPPEFNAITGAIIGANLGIMGSTYAGSQVLISAKGANLKKLVFPYRRAKAAAQANEEAKGIVNLSDDFTKLLVKRMAEEQNEIYRLNGVVMDAYKAISKGAPKTEILEIAARRLGPEGGEQVAKQVAAMITRYEKKGGIEAAQKVIFAALGRASSSVASVLELLGSAGPQIIITVLVEVIQTITEAFINAQMARPVLVQGLARASAPVDMARMLLNSTGRLGRPRPSPRPPLLRRPRRGLRPQRRRRPGPPPAARLELPYPRPPPQRARQLLRQLPPNRAS